MFCGFDGVVRDNLLEWFEIKIKWTIRNCIGYVKFNNKMVISLENSKIKYLNLII